MKRAIVPILLLFISLNSFSQDTKTTKNDGVWFVDEPASFLGGDINTVNTWVRTQLIVPYEVDGPISKGIYQFSIDASGKLCDIIILKNSHPVIDSLIIKILNSSPKWMPAKQDGKLVKQNFVIPVTICLQ
jgi:hypothetical protein